MPIKPNPNEDKQDFISRCISHEVGKGHSPEQSTAMCYNIWETNLKKVLLTENTLRDNKEYVKDLINKGWVVDIQSDRIAPIIENSLRIELNGLGLSEQRVKFNPIDYLFSKNKYDIVNISGDPFLDTLLLRSEKIRPSQQVLMRKEVKSIEHASEVEKLMRDELKLAKVKIVYRYGLRDGVSGPERLKTTRKFCLDVLDRGGQWTMEEIQNISNGMGLDPFIYCGGFWREKGTETTHPHCRHQFFATAILES